MEQADLSTPTTPEPPRAVVPPPADQAAGCLATFGSFLAGFVLACFSPTFYFQAVRRRAIGAVLFFFVFGLIITSLQTISLLIALGRGGAEMTKAFEDGSFPEITISNGIAEVSGKQPFILADENRMLVVLDTSGTYTRIDPHKYDQGILLTRTTFSVLNRNGQNQTIPLRDFQQAIDIDPIEINSETVSKMWAIAAVGLTLIVAMFLFLWHTVIRLAYLLLLALVLWGIIALLRPNTGFQPVLVTGLYAVVPALYLQFLFAQINVELPGLFTLFLIIFWVAALVLTTTRRSAAPSSSSFMDGLYADRPLRVWRVLIALPLLIDFALETIFHWQAWYVTWPLAFITLAVLGAVSLLPWLKQNTQPATLG